MRALGVRRSTIATARLYAERSLLSVRVGARARPNGRILCYHSVGTPAWGVNDVSPGRFRRQLESALRQGYRFVPAREIALTGGGPRELAVTFDDGLSSVAANAAPILAELRIPWSIFIVSDWADGRHHFGEGLLLSWSKIADLADRGVEVGSHSVTHPNFGRLRADEVREELGRSRAAIERHLGRAPSEFAIPIGGSLDWSAQAQALAGAAGYDIVYAQSDGLRPEGTTPRTFVTRFDGDRLFAAALRGAFDEWEEPT